MPLSPTSFQTDPVTTLDMMTTHNQFIGESHQYGDMMHETIPPNFSLVTDDDSVEVTNIKRSAAAGYKQSSRLAEPSTSGMNLGLHTIESLVVHNSEDEFDDNTEDDVKLPPVLEDSKHDRDELMADDDFSNGSSINFQGGAPKAGLSAPQELNEDQFLGGFDEVGSDRALNDDEQMGGEKTMEDAVRRPSLPTGYPHMSSALSLSTATQTHEVRMPMYLPTFKPATGCTNASDFVVRCFVARLRSGITVVKHGRSRWCKSRLRVLHIHQDGKSLTWKPAQGEPTSNKRPPKLDLTTCIEVRHAWSPDPLNKMFTGTPILRQKCEAANAHKSFALIFPKRTVDITAVTADQCKVLMEGFSALCFRLQVAKLAGRHGSKRGNVTMGEEEEVATTASVTLTNNSTQLSPAAALNRAVPARR